MANSDNQLPTYSDGDMPAYPTQVQADGYGTQRIPPIPGLTKRELFAAKAMQGYCANTNEALLQASYKCIAKGSVLQADALLAELAKKE